MHQRRYILRRIWSIITTLFNCGCTQDDFFKQQKIKSLKERSFRNKSYFIKSYKYSVCKYVSFVYFKASLCLLAAALADPKADAKADAKAEADPQWGYGVGQYANRGYAGYGRHGGWGSRGYAGALGYNGAYGANPGYNGYNNGYNRGYGGSAYNSGLYNGGYGYSSGLYSGANGYGYNAYNNGLYNGGYRGINQWPSKRAPGYSSTCWGCRGKRSAEPEPEASQGLTQAAEGNIIIFP